MHIRLIEAASASPEVKDIADYLKGLNPQESTVYNALGDPSRTITFPKWYGDTKKLLFPCKFYSDKDMDKIVKQGNEYITKTYGKDAYTLTLEKVYSSAFHTNCFVIRIK